MKLTLPAMPGLLPAALLLIGVWSVSAAVARAGDPAASQTIQPDSRTGSSLAVVVGDVSLAHTAQMFPVDARGKIVGKGDAARQIQRVLENLGQTLKLAGSDPQSVVKINVYVTRPEVALKAQAAFARAFAKAKPAMSFVVGNLALPDAMVALDAVAVTRLKGVNGAVKRFAATDKSGAVAILPPGPRYYISGQAKNGRLVNAAHGTLASLNMTLAWLGLERSNVVQLKAFMQPIGDAAKVQAEIADFFAPDIPPPVSYVAWKSPTNTPIEIEMIAADAKPPAGTGETVTFSTPPGLAVSKVFSRVARVDHGAVIYFSGLYGKGPTGREQINDIFGTLKNVLAEGGSDFEHLAKATYYVSDDDASNQLNEIRPKFFDPARPPAASKAMVDGAGMPGKTITLDLIAVAK